MSYCSRCGAQVSGAYCSNCGAKIEQTTASVGRSHSSYLEEPTFKLPEEHGATGKNMQTAKPDTSQYKLGWHKFLIFFFCGQKVLWASPMEYRNCSLLAITAFSVFLVLSTLHWEYLQSWFVFAWRVSKKIHQN